MASTLAARLPLYIVAEYPKSGGSWLSQMVADYLQIPFPRQRLPLFQSSVLQGHYLYSARFRNVICLNRDGRDSVVSLYYDVLFPNDRNDTGAVARRRAQLRYRDYDDITSNLPHFIEDTFARAEAASSPFRFSWGHFVRSWYGRSCVLSTYEELLADTPRALRRIVSQLTDEPPNDARISATVDKFSFESQSGRPRGTVDNSSFLRRGVAGSWNEAFSPEARKVFDALAGEELILLGYESDHSWAQGL